MNQADAYYRSAVASPPPSPLAMNVFGEYVEADEPAYAVPPCRSIPVTDEMRRADAEAQARRERPAAAWRIKAELSEANLRTVARKASALREPGVRRAVILKPAPAQTPLCAGGCGRRLRRDRLAMGICSGCNRRAKRELVEFEARAIAETVSPVLELPQAIPVVELEIAPVVAEVAKPEPRSCSEGCGRPLRSDNRSGVCRRCGREGNALRKQRVEAARAVRPRCVTCEAPLRRDNTTRVLCARCKSKGRAYYKPKHPELRGRTCCHEGCGRGLRAGKNQRADGLCGRHGDVKDRRGSQTHRARRMSGACRECGVAIGARASTGLCPAHMRAGRKIRTVLRAGSAEEHALNRLWAGHSLGDKYALLHAAGGGR